MQHHQHIMFVDIETVPLAADLNTLTERLQSEWGKKARILTRDTTGDIDPARLFSDKAGVYSEFAKVVCIGIGSMHHSSDGWKLRLKSLASHDEQQLLADFSNVIARFTAFNSQTIFCGHNIKEFDIPFLCRRMLVNNLPLPAPMNMAGKKPWENPHLDTLELWKFGDYKNYTSLALLAEILGIPSPKDDIDGSMVADVYYKNNDLPRIARYCLQDVATSARVFFRLKGEAADFETVIVDE